MSGQEIGAAEVNARLGILARQRNEAQDGVVVLGAIVETLKARVKELEDQLRQIEPQS